MNSPIIAILDALDGVRLLPRRAGEADVVYGYVAADLLRAVAEQVSAALRGRGYEVHRCEWLDEVVLLAINNGTPLALRLTASAAERYNLYVLSRPQSAQTLWQWAQAMVRDDARKRREPWP